MDQHRSRRITDRIGRTDQLGGVRRVSRAPLLYGVVHGAGWYASFTPPIN
jgi:hypothetical protein